MKKIISIITLLLIVTNIQAQFWKDQIRGNGNVMSKTRSIGQFDQMDITGNFDIKLVKGTTGKLELQTDENLFQVVETYVRGHKLFIKINSKFNVKRFTKLKIVLPVDKIERISITGSALVSSKESFDWNYIKFNVLGSGRVQLALNSKKISASVTGSGNIALRGNANDVSYKVTGSGSIIGRELKSDYAKASVTGSGDIYLKAPTDKLKASVTGSGGIYYYGTPDSITSKAMGSGSIIQK